MERSQPVLPPRSVLDDHGQPLAQHQRTTTPAELRAADRLAATAPAKAGWLPSDDALEDPLR